MAAPIIYTGENYRQYVPSQGKALAALGQLAQQTQRKKEMDLRRSREDRDMMADLMSTDPVYVTSNELQTKLAQSVDSGMADMAAIYKEIGDRSPNTEDLMRLQHRKARMQAESGQLKAWDEELQRSTQLVKSRPDIYDARQFAEAYSELKDTGVMPAEGLLYPSVKNPISGFMDYASKKRGTVKERGREWNPTTRTYETSYYYPNEENTSEDELINLYGQTQWGQYHIQHSFDDPNVVNPAIRADYLNKAGGDEESAANMWFQKSVEGKAYPKIKPKSIEVKPPVSTSTSKVNRGIWVDEDGGAWDGRNKLFGVAEMPNDDGGTTTSIKIISKAGRANSELLDVRLLELPDGVETSSKNVYATPLYADKNYTYWNVDKSGLKNMVVTDSGMKALGVGIGNFDKAGVDSNGKQLYTFKTDVDENVKIKTITSRVIGMLDNWTGRWSVSYVGAVPKA